MLITAPPTTTTAAAVSLAFLLLALALSVSADGWRFLSGGDSVHDLLRDHGLPGGLLPRAVTGYGLDEATGLLEARLARACYAKYDGELAFFDTVVRGNLSFGALRGVEGLSQEELFVWLPVKGIVVADPGSGVILFDIGVARKQLPRSAFEDPPDCQPNAPQSADAADPDPVARLKEPRSGRGEEMDGQQMQKR